MVHTTIGSIVGNSRHRSTFSWLVLKKISKSFFSQMEDVTFILLDIVRCGTLSKPSNTFLRIVEPSSNPSFSTILSHLPSGFSIKVFIMSTIFPFTASSILARLFGVFLVGLARLLALSPRHVDMKSDSLSDRIWVPVCTFSGLRGVGVFAALSNVLTASPKWPPFHQLHCPCRKSCFNRYSTATLSSAFSGH